MIHILPASPSELVDKSQSKLQQTPNYYTVSVSFQPKIIKHALDDYAVQFGTSKNSGPHQYPSETYATLGL